MVIFKRESTVERTLDFVAKFAASFAVNDEEGKENQPDADNTFLTFLFDFLLKVNEHSSAASYHALSYRGIFQNRKIKERELWKIAEVLMTDKKVMNLKL